MTDDGHHADTGVSRNHKFSPLALMSALSLPYFNLLTPYQTIVLPPKMITANQTPLAYAGGGIRILLPLVLVLAASIDAFSFTIPKLNPANPALQDLSQTVDGILVNIRLDVGQCEDSHMLINGLVVELHDDAIDAKKAKSSVPLPGSSGPNPHLSSGAKSLQVLDAAHFIGHDGINHVDMQDGCWEMVSLQDIFLLCFFVNCS